MKKLLHSISLKKRTKQEKTKQQPLTFSIRIIVLLVLLIGCQVKVFSQNVTIIESQSNNPGHLMDTVWRSVAYGLGMNPLIVPQSTLYDTANLTTTDVLIVSSGVITLSTLQIAAISEFMKSGRSLYIQGEYDCSAYNTNSVFESLVDDNGGSFDWNGTIAGTLAPMDVLGNLGTTPNTVTPLSYFWYGCRGNACTNVEPFLKYNNDYFGFIFCPPVSGYGRVVCTSDQDWINESTSIPLMDNILTMLASNNYECSGLNYLSAYLGSDTTICADSSLELSAGNSGFSYSWSTGSTDSAITVSTGGIYWLTVTNGSCSATDTIVVSEIPCSILPFNSSDTSICEKFCIDFFDASTNNPISWQWLFPGGSPSSSTDQNPGNICYQSPGTYDVTLITTNSTGSDTVTMSDFITVNATPAFPVITQNGFTLTSSSATTYQWQFNSVDIPGATNQSYDVQQSGYYSVYITDQNGCSNSTSTYILIEGIEELNSDANVSVYPNPSNGDFIVELSNCSIADHASIDVVNILGQIVFSSIESQSIGTFAGCKMKIDLCRDRACPVSTGVYFIEIKTENIFLRKKIVIEK